jgi:hypothetical protein
MKARPDSLDKTRHLTFRFCHPRWKCVAALPGQLPAVHPGRAAVPVLAESIPRRHVRGASSSPDQRASPGMVWGTGPVSHPTGNVVNIGCSKVTPFHPFFLQLFLSYGPIALLHRCRTVLPPSPAERVGEGSTVPYVQGPIMSSD